MTSNRGDSSPLKMHQGEALMIVASTYESLHKALLEAIQNGIDEGAKTLWVTVNQKTRNAAVRDDGNGCSVAKFEKALQSVCHSIKKADKLGRFGRGLVAPLGKCERFTFTSCPGNTNSGYNTWTFVTTDVQKQGESIDIPLKPRPDLLRQTGRQPRSGQQTVLWSTQVEITNFTTDRVLSEVTLEKLAADILRNYGKRMRKNRVTVELKITDARGNEVRRKVTARDVLGIPLPVVNIPHHKTGMVTFALAIAPKTEKQRKGDVVIGEAGDDFRFSIGSFFRSLPPEWHPVEAAEALTSGIFEGEIYATELKLHANRRSFEFGDAVCGLAIVIDEWYKKHGEAEMQKIKASRRDLEFQEVAVQCFRSLRALLKQPSCSYLLDVLKQAKMGTIGIGHADVDKKFAGTETAMTDGGQAGQKRKSSGDTGGQRDRHTPEKDKPGHIPMSATGPEGQLRKVVEDDSLGLKFNRTELEGAEFWAYHPRVGQVDINTYHPAWRMVEGRKSYEARMMEMAALQALTLHGLREEVHDTVRGAMERLTIPTAVLLVHGDTLAGRRQFRQTGLPGLGKAPTEPFPKPSGKVHK